MRLPVVCSIIAHVALLLIALRLPAAGLSRAARRFEVEINEPKQTVPCRTRRTPPPPEPPKPVVPKPQPLKNAQRHDEHGAGAAATTQPPPTQPQQPPPPSSLTMRPSAPVDLNLHGLGGIVVNNGAVHGGEGGPAGTFGVDAAQAVEAARRRRRSDPRQARRREGRALSAQARERRLPLRRSVVLGQDRDGRARDLRRPLDPRLQGAVGRVRPDRHRHEEPQAGSVSLRKREVHGEHRRSCAPS